MRKSRKNASKNNNGMITIKRPENLNNEAILSVFSEFCNEISKTDKSKIDLIEDLRYLIEDFVISCTEPQENFRFDDEDFNSMLQ